MMRVGASAAVLVLLCAGLADAFSTASVRFFGTGGGTAVDYVEVTVNSPMGEALLKARVGEVVNVRTPRGIKKFEIIELV